MAKPKGGRQEPPGGRPKGTPQSPQTKDAIRSARLQVLLMEHAEVSRMEPSQVTAALGLLKKYKPDLAAVELRGNADLPLTIITRAE